MEYNVPKDIIVEKDLLYNRYEKNTEKNYLDYCDGYIMKDVDNDVLCIILIMNYGNVREGVLLENKNMACCNSYEDYNVVDDLNVLIENILDVDAYLIEEDIICY